MIQKHVMLCGILMATVIAVFLVAGCGDNNNGNQATVPDRFRTSWSIGDEGRRFSISGDSTGHEAEETSEFELTLDNTSGDDPWEDEYCLMLVDTQGIIKKIIQETFSVPEGSEIRIPISVQFPADSESPLGLCIVIPDRVSAVTTLWIGTDRTGNAGPWPDIVSCADSTTE